MISEAEMDEMREIARNYIRYERAEFRKMRLGDRDDGLRSNQGLLQRPGEAGGEEEDYAAFERSEQAIPRLPEASAAGSGTT